MSIPQILSPKDLESLSLGQIATIKQNPTGRLGIWNGKKIYVIQNNVLHKFLLKFFAWMAKELTKEQIGDLNKQIQAYSLSTKIIDVPSTLGSQEQLDAQVTEIKRLTNELSVALTTAGRVKELENTLSQIKKELEGTKKQLDENDSVSKLVEEGLNKQLDEKKTQITYLKQQLKSLAPTTPTRSATQTPKRSPLEKVTDQLNSPIKRANYAAFTAVTAALTPWIKTPNMTPLSVGNSARILPFTPASSDSQAAEEKRKKHMLSLRRDILQSPTRVKDAQELWSKAQSKDVNGQLKDCTLDADALAAALGLD